MSNYFVEFLNHELALKQEERLKFLITKYKQDLELIKAHKANRVNKVNTLLSIIDSFEASLRAFKKLMPTMPEHAAERKKERPGQTKKHKEIHRKAKSASKSTPKPKKDLTLIKLGLEKIRDELENM